MYHVQTVNDAIKVFYYEVVVSTRISFSRVLQGLVSGRDSELFLQDQTKFLSVLSRVSCESLQKG